MQAAPPQLAWKLLGVNMLETLSDRMLNLFVLSKVWKKLTSAGGHLRFSSPCLCREPGKAHALCVPSSLVWRMAAVR